MKRKIITTGSLVLAIIICSIIDNNISLNKSYFTISCMMLLAGYWTIEFLIDLIYYTSYYDREFDLFVAEKVNKTSLTYNDIISKKEYYLKEFKRTRLKGKFYCYMKFFFAMGLFIFLLSCLFV